MGSRCHQEKLRRTEGDATCRQPNVGPQSYKFQNIRGGVVDHRTVERPDSCSGRARSARDRNFPFLASASIWSSHASASNRANQSRKSFNSFKLRRSEEHTSELQSPT